MAQNGNLPDGIKSPKTESHPMDQTAETESKEQGQKEAQSIVERTDSAAQAQSADHASALPKAVGEQSQGLIGQLRHLLSKPIAPFIVLALAAALYLMPGSGSYGLLDPWETHYGEVGRSMWESGDWISPWWGSYWPEGEICSSDAQCSEGHTCTATRAEFLPRYATCRPNDIGREGAYFFSKPALPMWMMAMGMSLLGMSEFSIRFFYMLSSIFCLLAVFGLVRRFFGLRAGVIAAVVLGTSPFFFFLGRQAVTDTPFVNFVSAGLCFFLLALFSPDKDDRYSAPAFWSFLAILLLLAIPQILQVTFSLGVFMRLGPWRIQVGPIHGAIYAGLLAAFCISLRKRPARTINKVLLYAFYLCMALAALAKGLLGLAIPGAVIFLYLVLSWNWGLLRKAEFVRGTLLVGTVGIPWYSSMFARHFRGFFDRFFIHDHFKRLTSGVHQLDTGEFDYFILWLGLGSFPWVGFIPAALGRVVCFFRSGLRTPADHVKLMLVLWFLLTFTLFTVSSTSFHHYIFPALPPIAILVALLINDILDGKVKRTKIVLLSASLLSGLVAWNFIHHPQRLVNLFTYRYDREWPVEADFSTILPLLVVLVMIPLVAWLLVPGKRFGKWAAAAVGTASVAFGIWCSVGYLATLSHTWSQKGLFDAYHESCTPVDPPATNAQGRPVCQEKLISYKMNWRGETLYSENTIIPTLNDRQFDYFQEQNGDKPFFALVEYRRLHSQFRARLRPNRRDFIRNIHNRNAKFALVKVDPPQQSE